ncbi:MAG TPA: pyridoxal phosphate-dependent aminotransferase [Anaerolineae bacterium]|nr:pyridoxal phosphate-dependent aminotransferase [Anaerolineae bacterium]
MLRLSEGVERIAASATMAISTRAKAMQTAGENVIALAAGEPDFVTPQHIRDAAKAALDEGFTYYTPAAGIPELRAAWAEKVGRERGVTYTADQVIVTAGGKQAVYNTVYALAGAKDEVIIPAPYWVSYTEQAKAVGAMPVVVQTRAEDGFKLSPQALREAITERTRLLILCSPSNPSGAVYSRDELTALAEVLVQHQVPVLSDEVYDALVYGEPFASIASLGREIYELTVIAGAVSKAYAMTGWRIGFAAGPRSVIAAAGRLQSHSTSGANSIAQKAALAAITGDQSSVEEMRQAFDRRRQYMLGRLRAMEGISCPEPLGAFYTFPRISAFYGRTFDGEPLDGSMAFCTALLEHAKLALVPGVAFGNDDHVRLSYAASMEEISEAMDRLEWFLSKLE